MLISDAYRQLNEELYERNQYYGTSGYKRADSVNDIARNFSAKTVLDYGCGRGTLKTELEKIADLPYEIVEYDPAVVGKKSKPLRADVVVCSDVLEHIEPECLYSVLDDINNIAKSAVFLVISTIPAMKTLSDGRNVHLIVETPGWWLPKLCARWRVEGMHEAQQGFAFVGSAK